jgi:ABC-type ATPase with predicted acetyltransferase domain
VEIKLVKPNQDIRDLIRDSKVFNWQVIEKLGIGDNSFYRMLRKPLSDADKNRILAAIEAIKSEPSANEDQKQTI